MVLDGFTVTRPSSLSSISADKKRKDDNNMLEMSESASNNKDKNTEEDKRKKARLLKKLKEQEGLVNANKQIMVRDRRRPRKSIKEMSVLNKRRRVIKNTARKEIQQQRNTLENMRHIELKKFSLEARELGHFVERVQKVKENRRLTMLFSKFKFLGEEHNELHEETESLANESTSTDKDDDSAHNTRTGNTNKNTKNQNNPSQSESMTNLLTELDHMSRLVMDNPTWNKMLQSTGDILPPAQPIKTKPKASPVDTTLPFGRRREQVALEAPAELQAISRLPEVVDKAKSKDDLVLNDRFAMRRCVSQEYVRLSSDIVTMPVIGDNSKLRSRRATTTTESKNASEEVVVDYNSWREREKRGEPLYSPVALSPVQSGLFSPDLLVEEDEKTANYRRKMNPRNPRFQMGGLAAGDMEFRQAMGKVPTDSGPKKVGFQGSQSIIEMQVNSKARAIAEKIEKVRAETMKKTKIVKTNDIIKNEKMAQLIHQQGESSRFIEEVRMLRTFASLCNCKYLRTDPEKIEERQKQYIDELVENVSRRITIRKRWRLPMMKMKNVNEAGIALPVISQSIVE